MSLALLLDTHAVLWSAHRPSALSERVREAVGDPENEVFISPVSAMEIATKCRRAKLGYETLLASDFLGQLSARGFRELPIRSSHAQLAGSFDDPHNDPWDRLLAAQARLEGLMLVTVDAGMAGFGVETFW